MKERIIIVFIAVTLGILVTTVGYLIYQSTKVIPDTADTPNKGSLLQSQETENKDGHYLKVNDPKNETVATTRTIQVKGETNPENTIVVSSNQEDVAVTPTANGSFSVSVTIDAGANKIITRSIAPNGETKTDERIVTFSSEDF